MDVDLLDLLGALAGGFLGATIGAVGGFVFAGFAVLAGIAALIGSGEPVLLNEFALGPFFGPHICFAGGVAAAAYAGRRGWIDSGRDILTPLVSLGKPSVLLIGAAFGAFGWIVQKLVALIPWFGTHVDSIAFTVVLSAVVARLVFGRTGLIGRHADGLKGMRRFSPTATHVWLAYQQRPGMALALGLFLGALSAWSAITLLAAYPDAPGVILLGFGVSAASLVFLAMGLSVPVTQHITLISAAAVGIFGDALADLPVVLVLVGALAGAAAALLGEVFSRFWLIRGDTHIDPPASAIWPLTLLMWGIAAAAGL